MAQSTNNTNVDFYHKAIPLIPLPKSLSEIVFTYAREYSWLKEFLANEENKLVHKYQLVSRRLCPYDFLPEYEYCRTEKEGRFENCFRCCTSTYDVDELLESNINDQVNGGQRQIKHIRERLMGSIVSPSPKFESMKCCCL